MKTYTVRTQSPKGQVLVTCKAYSRNDPHRKKSSMSASATILFAHRNPPPMLSCTNTQNNPHFPYLSLLKHTKSKQKHWQDHFASSLSFTSVQRSLYRTYVSVCFYVWTEAKVWNEAYIYIKKKRFPRNPTTRDLVGKDGEVDVCQEAKVAGEEKEGEVYFQQQLSTTLSSSHKVPPTQLLFFLSFIRHLGLRCLDVLGQPAEPFAIALPLEDTAHKHLQGACRHF